MNFKEYYKSKSPKTQAYLRDLLKFRLDFNAPDFFPRKDINKIINWAEPYKNRDDMTIGEEYIPYLFFKQVLDNYTSGNISKEDTVDCILFLIGNGRKIGIGPDELIKILPQELIPDVWRKALDADIFSFDESRGDHFLAVSDYSDENLEGIKKYTKDCMNSIPFDIIADICDEKTVKELLKEPYIRIYYENKVQSNTIDKLLLCDKDNDKIVDKCLANYSYSLDCFNDYLMRFVCVDLYYLKFLPRFIPSRDTSLLKAICTAKKKGNYKGESAYRYNKTIRQLYAAAYFIKHSNVSQSLSKSLKKWCGDYYMLLSTGLLDYEYLLSATFPEVFGNIMENNEELTA